MTIVYLMRHSKGNIKREFVESEENFQIDNEKYILSVEGENLAYKYSRLKELQCLSTVVSSNYVRCMSTAKYMADINKLPLIIDENFNERKFGINKKEELPTDFFLKQIRNHDYKLDYGESFNEVKKRMLKGLARIIKSNRGKKSLVVSHGSSIAFLLSKWCDVDYDKKYIIKFKGKKILEGFNSPELLELKFDEKNKLVNLRKIELKKLKTKTDKK